MKAHESYIAADVLNELIARLMDCRDPKAAVALLKSLVPEFAHERDNVDMEKAS